MPTTTLKVRPLSRKVHYPENGEFIAFKLFSKEEVKEWTKSGSEQAFDYASFREDSVSTDEQILNRQLLSRK